MGQNKRKAARQQKEQQQAERIFKIVCITLVALAIVMMIGYSFY